MKCKIAVDIGGTFTDFIILRENGGVSTLKVLTNPKNPGEVIKNAVSSLDCEVDEVIHATTLATNTLLGQENLSIPKTALLITKGFRDIIEIGRQNRPRLYDLYFEKPKQIVERDLRIEVDERVNANGNIIKSVNAEEISKISKELSEKGVISIAVSYLHSYLNPQNELITKQVLKDRFKYISISYEIAPEPREYERTSTTVINAALMPIVSSYLENLEHSLPTKNFYIMSSSGGIIDVEEASKKPVQLIESGPAAGVIASANFLPNDSLISFDMGGTTAKAGVIINGAYEITSEYEVGGEVHHGRVVKGSGYPIRFPFIDLAEVSAGGGTIIWRDEANALKVGPISAGADPGPICYNKGGNKPTITDANLVLGKLGDELIGGNLRLNKEKALQGLSKLGDPFEVSRNALELINLEMARAIRLVTVERGLDPTSFSLIAFGGAGPQHALYLADEIGIKKVVVPPYPGLFSALGLLLADWRFEIRKSFPKDLEKEYKELEKKLLERLKQVDYFIRYADIRYKGQGWELTVQLPSEVNEEIVRKTFEEKHLSTYGFIMKDREIEVVTIRVFAVRKRLIPKISSKFGSDDKPVGRRKVMMEDDWIDADVFVREKLPKGLRIKGPAIIEEYSSTTVIKPEWNAIIDDSIILVRE
ncbi:5-oxoprolinase [Sulfolobus sp. A20]|uniref:hydantoinase/oxoprolinase family protein n=2 Tax=Sulfolobaceae TaxID=118883 RepID=UPI0008460611|nr:hydantoinase/oxoprolinase family protein [Sulfolobus sp. A20]TRM74774.1 hydantoinase/oxoprolinase family protein [Sulfolobus sp. E5]TRM79000.1 hydantoinase/oxoprolinase family protein [Sulfolobus sp. B5]TRM82061.1 hydantoinase/oxoprolinase family protein [Sulfolobus sp. D5]TRM83587.1 hydantoinase/oxoprolinase family protein [Sulfolobus sp. A20-N-F6]TRM88153.1 hydantoinase/oxoprolinase family protein [Sulfolobus sp. E3]TRM88330.1 hydantoinase/oxoprolinase family protein [Sulfolobus sp. C3]